MKPKKVVWQYFVYGLLVYIVSFGWSQTLSQPITHTTYMYGKEDRITKLISAEYIVARCTIGWTSSQSGKPVLCRYRVQCASTWLAGQHPYLLLLMKKHCKQYLVQYLRIRALTKYECTHFSAFGPIQLEPKFTLGLNWYGCRQDKWQRKSAGDIPIPVRGSISLYMVWTDIVCGLKIRLKWSHKGVRKRWENVNRYNKSVMQ